MTASDFRDLLRRNEGKRVRVVFADGEIAIVTISHVDDEYSDFSYDVISSHRDRRRDVAYCGKWADVTGIEEISDGPGY